MQFGLDKVFGIYQQALKINSRRSEVIAGNLANADTPGFKARDIDFKDALQRLKGGMGETTLSTTHANHMGSSGANQGRVDEIFGEMRFRTPSQPSLDGNTVDPLLENAAFMENAVMYQTNLEFLGGQIKQIKSALKGE